MFIPYLGEKSKFSNFIIPNIPTDISTYVEPFGGAYGIYFSLDLTQFHTSTQFIYNDMNPLNSNLFTQLGNPDFISIMKETKATEDMYYQIQSSLNNNNWNNIEKAVNWLILLCCSYSQYNITDGKWRGDYEFEVVKLKFKYENHYLDKIESVYGIDYKEIINKYDSESSFFYLDPPYRTREHYYINHNFTDESHYELSQILKNIKGRFALSYYHFPEIDEWYKGCNIIKNKTLMGTEFLIMNY